MRRGTERFFSPGHALYECAQYQEVVGQHGSSFN